MHVSDEMDRINVMAVNPTVKKKDLYQNILDFIVEEVGTENATEIFKTLDVNKVDLQEAYLCFLDIVKSYDRPMRNAQAEEMSEQLNSADLDKVLEILRSTDNIEKLQKLAKNQQNTANFRNMQK
jgi:hypothetical protein